MRRTSIGLLLLTLGDLCGCTHEIGFDAGYVPPERPSYVADGALLVVLPEEQEQFTYEGPPDSEVGNFTTMSIPLGSIVKEIARDVFGSCFARGVAFATSREAGGEFVLALEGNMDDFVYRYTRIIDRGFSEDDPDVWIVPEVDISFSADVFDSRGTRVLSKVYDSGVRAGERYMVTSRPSEKINEVLHTTLHDLITEVAEDLYPLLIGECTVIDVN